MKPRFLIFISFALLIGANAYASRGPPLPFFDIPSYIDPEYKAPDYSEMSYGQKTKFGLILQQYKFDAGAKESSDAAARAASEKQEPKSFSKYSKAAEAFNSGDYEQALKGFTEIRDGFSIGEKLRSIVGGKNYSWAKEAATYMVARCQLIMAQKNWDGYSEPAKTVDLSMLQSADASYQQYLKEYPQGMYANSARNIRRRIFFLSGDQAALDKGLKQAMHKTFPSAPQSPDTSSFAIVDEFKTHFHGEIDVSSDSPMLIAYRLLGQEKPNVETVAALEVREKDFSTYPGLFRYVHALALYQSEQYQQLVEKIPEAAITKDVLSLSTQILRARALQHIGKPDEAIEAMRKMHAVSSEDAVELEIAYLKIDDGDGLWIYTKESPLKSEKILRSIAQFAFTDSELEGAVGNKKISGDKRKFLMDELAKRYVLTQRFKAMSDLLNKQYGGLFVPLKSSVTALAANTENTKALADVGEFLYQNYVTPSSTVEGYASYWSGDALTDLSPRCKPCSNFKERTANYKPPIAFFQSAVKNSMKSGEKSESEAKALHYIVRCGRGGEFRNRCVWSSGWGEPADDSSKNAFMRLHKLYKKSAWTQKTPYYY